VTGFAQFAQGSTAAAAMDPAWCIDLEHLIDGLRAKPRPCCIAATNASCSLYPLVGCLAAGAGRADVSRPMKRVTATRRPGLMVEALYVAGGGVI